METRVSMTGLRKAGSLMIHSYWGELGGRVLITGGPDTGKTFLADEIASMNQGVRVRHCDDLILTHSWSLASFEVAKWLNESGPWVIEGIQVPRALRKWLKANWEGVPFDSLIWLDELHDVGHEATRKGVCTVMSAIYPELLRRNGFKMHYRSDLGQPGFLEE